MSAESPPTLVEFLLARLDVAEGLAHCSDLEPWSGYGFGIDVSGWRCPPEVLADVSAIRAVVELHTGHHECVGVRHGRMGTVLVAEGYASQNDPTLCLLALPYAGHPDYSDEWKPVTL